MKNIDWGKYIGSKINTVSKYISTIWNYYAIYVSLRHTFKDYILKHIDVWDQANTDGYWVGWLVCWGFTAYQPL